MSDQTVVTTGDTDMLAYFKQLQRDHSNIVETHPHEDQAGNSATSSQAHPPRHHSATGARPDGHSEQTVISEPSVVRVGETVPETPDEELDSNPSTYYNGRRWAEKYGHPDSSEDRSE